MRPRLLAWAIVINRAFCAPVMGQSAAEERVTPATTSAANAVGTPPQSPAIAPVAGDNLQRADENGGAPKITPAPQKPEPQSEATSAAPESDHAGVVRRYAVGYLGFANIPFGALADLALTEPAQDSGRLARAPILGIRYWASPQWGIDAGVGFSMGSGSQN